LGSYRKRGIQVAMSLPSEMVILQELQLPRTAEKDIPHAIYWALKEKMEQSPDIFQRDHLVLDSSRQGQRETMNVRVYMAKQDDVVRIEALFDRLGLSVQYLEPSDVAMAASFTHCPPSEIGENPLVMNIGGEGSSITIMHRNLPFLSRQVGINTRAWTASLALKKGLDEDAARQLVFEHGVSYFRQRFDQPAAGELQEVVFKALETDIQQLALEIHRTIDYFQSSMHKGKVEQLVLAGGGSKLADLDHYLDETLGIPCIIYDPLEQLDFSACRGDEEKVAICRQQAARFMVAVGMACRE
ncbi:MAG: pilus assembly protein PilM, partial [Pseudomonadota bacterium]|nr:pilus assembly protein PilM [Pseudomonadota bacterium]